MGPAIFGPAAKAVFPARPQNGGMPTPSSHKVVLVPDRRGAVPGVRRYRLARLTLNPDPCAPREGFDYLKRTYD
jgi:hypothetical protein